MEAQKVPEMETLNLESMDVNELEKRLELALAGDAPDAWGSCCVDGGGSCPNLESC